MPRRRLNTTGLHNRNGDTHSPNSTRSTSLYIGLEKRLSRDAAGCPDPAQKKSYEEPIDLSPGWDHLRARNINTPPLVHQRCLQDSVALRKRATI